MINIKPASSYTTTSTQPTQQRVAYGNNFQNIAFAQAPTQDDVHFGRRTESNNDAKEKTFIGKTLDFAKSKIGLAIAALSIIVAPFTGFLSLAGLLILPLVGAMSSGEETPAQEPSETGARRKKRTTQASDKPRPQTNEQTDDIDIEKEIRKKEMRDRLRDMHTIKKEMPTNVAGTVDNYQYFAASGKDLTPPQELAEMKAKAETALTELERDIKHYTSKQAFITAQDKQILLSSNKSRLHDLIEAFKKEPVTYAPRKIKESVEFQNIIRTVDDAILRTKRLGPRKIIRLSKKPNKNVPNITDAEIIEEVKKQQHAS